jgi:hypothetical protein
MILTGVLADVVEATSGGSCFLQELKILLVAAKKPNKYTDKAVLENVLFVIMFLIFLVKK